MESDRPETTEEDCGRCFNSGWIVVHAGTLAYVGPGPCPDDAPGVISVRCKNCGRAWTHIYDFPGEKAS